MGNLRSIIGEYRVFLKLILEEVIAEGFELADFVQLDHMCYRVASLAAYATKKQELLTVGELLGETQINGRLIATFRLHEPIRYDQWRVDTIELPAPKAGAKYDEGLEHIEFVLFDDKDYFLDKYASKQFEMKAADRGVNPEIGYRLPTYTVKSHLLNLPTVVYLERKLGINAVHDGK